MPNTSAMHLVNASKFEPQRRGNFEVQFEGFPGGETLTLTVQSMFLPGEESEVIELPYANEKVRYPGGTTFNGGELVIRDFVDINTYKLVMDWRKQVYDPETGQIHFSGDYKKDGYVIMTAPDGSVERKWRILRAWVSAVAPGSLEHGSYDINTISCTITFDKAIYEG